MRKTIVISAVNIRKGGTLTILRECLSYLSTQTGSYRIVAIVHRRELCDYPDIEYIELPATIKSWGRRLWAEYVTFSRISKELAPVCLWLSLHDTTPRVQAERQAVYCQTSFPFMKPKWQDLHFDPKIVLFSLFTSFAYRINVKRNRYLIVQQESLREGLSRMLGVSADKFIVAPPELKTAELDKSTDTKHDREEKLFIYPATPDCHKNFETLCEAASLLEKEIGLGKFKIVLTVSGVENRYAAWLKKHWGKVKSIEFRGLLPKEELFGLYRDADALVFPSRIETWGLPVSEFLPTGKALILADLPYAHESSAGSAQTAFFDPGCASALKEKMKEVILGRLSSFAPVPKRTAGAPAAGSWGELFSILLDYQDLGCSESNKFEDD